MKKKVQNVMTWKYFLPAGVLLLLVSGNMFGVVVGIIGMVFVGLGLFDMIVKFLRQETEEQEEATRRVEAK